MGTAPGRPCLKARLARAIGLDRNPLRRASDRAEAWIRAGLLALFLVAAPVAAVAAGHWASHAWVQADSAQLHSVRAVLLRSADGLAGPAAAAGADPVWVRARWESDDGSVRTGEVLAPVGARPGTVVTVWLDAADQVTSPPGPSMFAGAVMPTMVLVVVIVAVTLKAALRLIQWFLNWRRLAAWEAAWATTGPRWTGRKS